MARKHSKHVVTHLPVGTYTANAVHYRLLQVPSLSRKTMKGAPDKRTAYAKIVTKEVVTQEELEEWIAARNPTLDPALMHHAIDALMRGILDHLKAGRKVTLKNHLTFAAAFEGRVDPERPFEVRHLPLAPWVRFTPKFIDKLNTGVRVAYNEPFLPPRVKVKSVKVIGDILRLSGEFRHPEALAADILMPSGEVLPCEISIPAHTTRPYAESLTLVPTQSANQPISQVQSDSARAMSTSANPFADCVLQMVWIDGANETQKLTFDL